jgi:hypothetical protein
MINRAQAQSDPSLTSLLHVHRGIPASDASGEDASRDVRPAPSWPLVVVHKESVELALNRILLRGTPSFVIAYGSLVRDASSRCADIARPLTEEGRTIER